MVSCEIITRLTQTPLVGAYLPPSTLEHLPDLEEVLQRFRGPIVLGGYNVDLDEVKSSRRQRVSDLFAEYGVIDLVRHLQQHLRF